MVSIRPADIEKLQMGVRGSVNRVQIPKEIQASATVVGGGGGLPTVNLAVRTHDFNTTCARMDNRMLQSPRDDNSALVDEFARLMELPENRNNRYVFMGVTEVVISGSKPKAGSSKAKLAQLSPALKKESALAARPIDWRFTSFVAQNKQAEKSFLNHASKVSKNQRESVNPDTANLVKQVPRGLWGSIWNDICNTVGEDYDTGAVYGEYLGAGIGTVGGGMAGFTAFGPAGIAPIAYEGYETGGAIGTVVGGIVGAVGSAIGTTTGWIVGTMEANWAQRGAVETANPTHPRRSRTSGLPPGTSDTNAPIEIDFSLAPEL